MVAFAVQKVKEVVALSNAVQSVVDGTQVRSKIHTAYCLGLCVLNITLCFPYGLGIWGQPSCAVEVCHSVGLPFGHATTRNLVVSFVSELDIRRRYNDDRTRVGGMSVTSHVTSA